MPKKNMALVFGITDNYTFALCNVLLGLKKHHKVPFWDDIIVLHTNVSEKNQKIANAILPCEFRIIQDQAWVTELAKKLSSKIVRMYSEAALFRYYCFDLLNEYHKLFWSDCDILIQGDISGITKYGDRSGYAACISNGFLPVEISFKQLIPGYNMFTPNYNSGTLVFSDKLAGYENYCKWCKEKTLELADKLDMPDQGILNLLIQEFHIQPEIIDDYAYQCHPTMPQAMDRVHTLIVHAYGTRKFWNDAEYQRLFPEWLTFHAEYTKISEQILHSAIQTQSEIPLISVVMSTFTRIQFLKAAVQSILDQTYGHFELIVVVEQSEKQEETVSILKSFHDERIVIIQNEKKLGFAASLNIALDHAKGTYIARMDDDDISLPERFEKQIRFLSEHKEIDIVGTHAETFMGSSVKWDKYPTDYEYARIELLRGTVVCHPTVMMRKERLNQFNLRYDPAVFAEDYHLWARAVEYLNIANIPEILYRYRASGMNATVVNQAKVHASHLEIMKMQFKRYLHMEPSEDEISLFNGRIDIIERTYSKHRKEALELLNKFKRKIAQANRSAHFYQQEKLEIYLGLMQSDKLKKKCGINLKKWIKGCVRPISDRVVWTFSRRTYDLINRRSDGIMYRLTELENTLGQLYNDSAPENVRKIDRGELQK